MEETEIQLTLSEEASKRIQLMQQQLGCSTVAALVRTSFSLLEWVLAHPDATQLSLSNKEGLLLGKASLEEVLKNSKPSR